jgi:hypothetical protein
VLKKREKTIVALASFPFFISADGNFILSLTRQETPPGFYTLYPREKMIKADID